jgi:hypothetical protein
VFIEALETRANEIIFDYSNIGQGTGTDDPYAGLP